MLPFFIVDGACGAHGLFYDNLAVGEVDLGCTIDNYHGLFRAIGPRTATSTITFSPAPRCANVVRGVFPG